jgi:hypothetical protein
MIRMALLGALIAIVGAFPLAASIALVYGFPVPFAGKMSGPEALIPSQFAVFMYGIIGGFGVLALAGALAGAIACKVGPNPKSVAVLCVCLALLFSAGCLALLANLDLIIGPW